MEIINVESGKFDKNFDMWTPIEPMTGLGELQLYL